jgi:hypothetical protein
MPLLVYEFISNGNLFKNIHDKRLHLLASKDSIGDYPCAWLPAFSSRSAAIVPVVQTVFPVISGVFKSYFVNFKLFNIIFV